MLLLATGIWNINRMLLQSTQSTRHAHQGLSPWLHSRLHGLPCCARAGGTGQAAEAPCPAAHPATGWASPQGSALHRPPALSSQQRRSHWLTVPA